MTKYLTPKVRGCPGPAARGMGGLIQECEPPDLCREGTRLVAAVGLQRSRILGLPQRAHMPGRAKAGDRGQASAGVSERPVRWGRARGWSAGKGVATAVLAEAMSSEHVRMQSIRKRFLECAEGREAARPHLRNTPSWLKEERQRHPHPQGPGGPGTHVFLPPT